MLCGAISSVPEPDDVDSLRVLLTTSPGEPHGLGLLMAEAVLAMQGCRCVSLGAQTPLWDLVLAAGALRSNIVALSFSGVPAFNTLTNVPAALQQLRRKR